MRGRKRVARKNIPPHIDQDKIPKGVYWDDSGNGRWYVFERNIEGRISKRIICWRDASLSDLHSIAEEIKGVNRKTLKWLLEQFNESIKFKKLASSTRKHYIKYYKIICNLQTKAGPLGELEFAKLTPALFQRIVDRTAEEGHPTKANHILRYARRVFSWGINRGICHVNPAKGVEQADELKAHKMPSDEAYEKFLAFAKARNKFVWASMELLYLCRLRRVEVVGLTDANCTKPGVVTNRRKKSKDNIVKWTPRLREVWGECIRIRDEKMARSKAPIPIQPERRYIFCNRNGTRVKESTLSSAWQKLIRAAFVAGVISEDQRFSLHGLKHRGVTKTPGNKAEKQEASGHRSEAAFNVYDHSLPLVNTPEG